MTFEEWYRANRQGTNINEFEAARDAWFAGQAVVNAAWNRAEALARPEDAKLPGLEAASEHFACIRDQETFTRSAVIWEITRLIEQLRVPQERS